MVEDQEGSTYVIRVREGLGRMWASRFPELEITAGPDNSTVLTGVVVDQAELHGLLTRIRDLGLTIVSIERGEEGRSDASARRDDRLSRDVGPGDRSP